MRMIGDIGLEFTSAILVTACILLVCESLLWRNAHRSKMRRFALPGALVLLAPAMVLGLTALVHGFRVIDLVFVRGFYMHLVLPVVVIPVQLGVAATLFGPIRDSGALGWRLAAHSTSLSFLAINAVNWCTPGYCGWYGFPFTFYQYSDVVIQMNGMPPDSPYSVGALAANLLLLAVVLAALAATRVVAKRHEAVV